LADDSVIRSPVPGVFYRRPDPGSPPFVEEGAEVEPGTVVGVVEVMKQFHELRSETAGRVRAFVVDNEDVVNAGDTVVELDGSG